MTIDNITSCINEDCLKIRSDLSFFLTTGLKGVYLQWFMYLFFKVEVNYVGKHVETKCAYDCTLNSTQKIWYPSLHDESITHFVVQPVYIFFVTKPNQSIYNYLLLNLPRAIRSAMTESHLRAKNEASLG